MSNLTPTARVTVTLPAVLPLGIECFINYHDDDRDSINEAFIAFNQPIHGDDDYLAVFDLETVSDLVKAIDEKRDYFDPDNGDWAIDLTEPINFIYA
jgi:hypothetical protein